MSRSPSAARCLQVASELGRKYEATVALQLHAAHCFCRLTVSDAPLIICLQVASELGRQYEDTVALLEPDQEEWSDRLQYEFGLDAADGNPYPGDWITREVLEEPGMLERVQEMAVADVAGISSSSSSSGGAADGWGA